LFKFLNNQIVPKVSCYCEGTDGKYTGKKLCIVHSRLFAHKIDGLEH